MANTLTGRCACGAICYRLRLPPIFVNCCHCDDCQRHTGSAFVINALIETDAIELSGGHPIATPVSRENGPHDIYRCAECQTALWSDYGHRPNVRFVRVGTLEQPYEVRPGAHIFTRFKVKWLELPSGTPAFRDYYESSEHWPEASLQRWNVALEKT